MEKFRKLGIYKFRNGKFRKLGNCNFRNRSVKFRKLGIQISRNGSVLFRKLGMSVITLLQYDSSTLGMRDKVERSPLHLAVLAKKYESPSEFHEVIFDHILKKVILLTQSLTEQDCPIIDYQDLLGKTAIHYCISLNNLHALDMLLPENSNLLLRDKGGNTPLHQAVLNHEYSSLLRPLLISINAESSVNEYHYSLNSKLIPPLQLAIQVDNIPAINILTIRLQLLLSIDEMMLKFYGKSVLRQYMPAKPNKYGIKLWAVACACCGYSLTQNIYLGSSVQSVGGARCCATTS